MAGLAPLTALGRVVSSSGSIRTAAVLSGVYLYSQLQTIAGQGVAQPGKSQLRSSIASTSIARRTMRFRMRDGSRVRCRIVEAGGLLSVNVDRDYDIPGIDWDSMRTIVDIGAHVGTFTFWAASRAPHARILAVEPNPDTFPMLSSNIRDNRLQDRVVAMNVAVGGKAGRGRLEMLEHPLGTRLSRTGSDGVDVEVQTVPALLASADIQQVDFLKMDCEGMEYEIFESLDREQLGRIRAIACEYHPQPGRKASEIDAVLEGAGFDVQRREGEPGVIWATRSH